MAATASPGKVYSLPNYALSYGTPFLPTGLATGGRGRVFWVGNASGLPSGNGSSPDYPFSTLDAALAKCTSGRGDIVYVLEGHAENLSSATSLSSLVAGTKIIGLGYGASRPAFTFSAASSLVTVSVANVMIRNCQFLCAGPRGTTALTVTLPWVISGAGFTFWENEVQVAVDSDQLCTDCFSLTATADDATFANNYIWGGAGGVITTALKTTGAVDRLKLIGNTITAEVATAASGVLLDLSNAACVDHVILNNYLANKTASAKFVIKPHATSTGIVDGNTYLVGDSATGPASLGFTTFTTTYVFGRGNSCVTTTAASAILCPAADS
jgi:hypothetical protein